MILVDIIDIAYNPKCNSIEFGQTRHKYSTVETKLSISNFSVIEKVEFRIREGLTSHATVISASKSSHLAGVQGVLIAKSNPDSPLNE